jgi:hypothetical protein
VVSRANWPIQRTLDLQAGLKQPGPSSTHRGEFIEECRRCLILSLQAGSGVESGQVAHPGDEGQQVKDQGNQSEARQADRHLDTDEVG